MEYIHVNHLFAPVFNADSEILILGSFPSVKSREQNFYYGHPQNRFWKLLPRIYGKMDIKLETIDEKKEFLLENHIALWDVIKSCDIKGSSDSSIRNIEVNDLDIIIKNSNINKIILMVEKHTNYIQDSLAIKICLPLLNCHQQVLQMRLGLWRN